MVSSSLCSLNQFGDLGTARAAQRLGAYGLLLEVLGMDQQLPSVLRPLRHLQPLLRCFAEQPCPFWMPGKALLPALTTWPVIPSNLPPLIRGKTVPS